GVPLRADAPPPGPGDRRAGPIPAWHTGHRGLPPAARIPLQAAAALAGPRPLSTALALGGRVAVVTGAAGLLGRRHCHALAAAGARVVAVDLQAQACTGIAAEIRDAHGTEVLACACDITDAASLRRVCGEALAWGGAIDVLVNNAAVDDKVEAPGAEAPVRFEDYPLAAWERSVRVNLT